MATLDAVQVSTQWTLVYDASVSGPFEGSVQCTGPQPTILRVGPSEPTENSGFMINSTPQAIALTGTDKLYGRAYGIIFGKSQVILG